MPGTSKPARWFRLRRPTPPEGQPAPPDGLPPDPTRNLKLPRPLYGLGRRLAVAFSPSELRDLAQDVAIDPASVPGETLQQYALGLARAAWCRGRLPELLAAAARERPHADWTFNPAALPRPPAEGCEDDPLSIFSHWTQTAALVVIPLLAAATVALGLFLASRPARLDNEFNIAVAAVDVSDLMDAPPAAPASGLSCPGSAARPMDPALATARYDAEEVGQLIQDQVVLIVEDKLREIGADTVSVSGTRMPVVGNETEAARLAEQVNAQLVIYGSAGGLGGLYTYRPRFFIDLDTIQVDLGGIQVPKDEMSGETPLEAPLCFTLLDLINPTPPTGQTAAAAALLTNFVRALVKLAADDLPAAERFINAARIQTALYVVNHPPPFAGREVIYLFASHIARLQALAADTAERRDAYWAAAETAIAEALKIRPDYGRAVIGRANLFYDQKALRQALDEYAAAAALPNQPAEWLIAPKAALGMGNVNLWQMPADPPCDDETRRLADAALGHYAAVIAAHDDAARRLVNEGSLLVRLGLRPAPRPDARLVALATSAHAYRGEVYRLCGDDEAAAAELRAALALEPKPALAAEIAERLERLEQEGQP